MNLSRMIVGWFCGALFMAGSATAQNLLINGSFEQPAFSYGTANYPLPSIPGWTSTADFEVWNQLQGPGAAGNQYLELDVSTCTTISQTIPTDASKNYVVSLAFGARDGVADNRIEVLWNGTIIGSASADGTGQSGIVWTNYAYPAPGAAGTSTLEIRNVDTCDGVGSMLDNVAVVVAPTPAPAFGPFGLVLLAGGFGLLALVLLRRRRAV
jgi:hypothetical protein